MKKKFYTSFSFALILSSLMIAGCSCQKEDNDAKINSENVTENKTQNVTENNSWNSSQIKEGQTIGIHDPSVFFDPVSGEYFSYGSHIVAGNSKDLISWQHIPGASVGYNSSNNLFTKHYLEEFKEVYDWLGSDVKEGIWAIDVTYSEAAKNAGNDPYLMYVTVCNGSFKSAICLATSSSPAGPFSYKGMIVCSDYRESEVNSGHTNLLDVLGVKDSKELKDSMRNYYFTKDSADYKASLPDCIDPAPYYDGDGNLYLTYGSFTCKGGLRVLKLDKTTGLRSDSNYDFKSDGSSDPYFGLKIANSNGEGPYVLTVKSDKSSTGYYYFLFWSQGNLRATGGYNMRMFRSEYPDKGFVDMAGNSALASMDATKLGVRIMDNFKFTSMTYPSCANGGNSAIVTKDNKIFVHYHSKSSDSSAYGENGFIIKSNQMFFNEDGWLVTSPFKYNGESLGKVDTTEITGDYEFIHHRLEYFKDPGDYSQNFVDSSIITLTDDGKITGAASGSWEISENYITLTIGDDEYKGVIFNGSDESSNRTSSILFTASADNNRTVWGQKVYYDSARKLALELTKIKFEKSYTSDFTVPSSGFFGSDISWSENSDAISVEGDTIKVIPLDEENKVTLTATLKLDGETLTKDFNFTVPMEEFDIPSTVSGETISLPKTTKAGKNISWSSSDMSVINTDTFKVTIPSSGSAVVTITGKIDGSSRVITKDITVMNIPNKIVYSENFDSSLSIDASNSTNMWYCPNAADKVSLQAKDGGKYVLFAPGQQNSRGLINTLPTGLLDDVFLLEFDAMLKAGDNQVTELSVACQNFAYLNGVINDGINFGYILKLSSNNSEEWKINDTDTVTIKKDSWVHISLFTDIKSGSANLIISDTNGTELYNGTIKCKEASALKGFYIRGGRYNASIGIDNIVIKK